MKYVIILCTTTFGDGLMVLEIFLLTSETFKSKDSQEDI